jgi:2-polyprenyl-6-methoxyphenol hydroxylase-like FAD-dependent oxidoreductase
MRIIVTGAGIAGLTSALFLARAGHDVVLLERDATPLPHTADEAFLWDRRGAPQVRHSHAFLARLRNLLRDELPDVLEDLLAAGATQVGWQDLAPDTLDDRTPRPGDEDIVFLACRRTTFEWVLRNAALRTERVELRDGVKVTGLTTQSRAIAPRVTGVVTDGGVIEADLVVDAGGRHSAVRTMLHEIGIDVPEEKHDTGFAYLSRFYRLLDGGAEPDRQAFNGGSLGYLGYGIFRGDNRTFSVTLAVGTHDEEMRSASDTARFDIITGLIPASRGWVSPAVSQPMTDVNVMAGLVNRMRSFVVDGRPSVLGLIAVGDANICTNPVYGRGCSLGAVHAGLMASAVRDHGNDYEALALQFHAATQRDLVPWYHASVAQDEASKRALLGGDAPANQDFLRSVLNEGLGPLSRIDATVHRALLRTANLLTAPEALLSDQVVMQRVMSYWQARDTRPPEPPLGPTRDEMVAAVAGAS